MHPVEETARLALSTGLLDLTTAFTVERAISRNCVHLVRQGARTIAVKWHATEAARRHEEEQLRSIRRSVPGVLVPDVHVGSENLLVTSTSSTRSLGSAAGRRLLPRRAIDRLGKALRQLHAGPPPAGGEPRGLSFHPHFATGDVLDDSVAVRRVLARLQADSQVDDALAALQDALARQKPCWVHGDIRVSNILLGPAARRLFLIDWEHGGLGRPATDIGAAIAMVLEQSMYSTRPGPDDEGVRRLLAGYSPGEGGVPLRTALRCAGLRFLQSAVENAASENEPGPVTTRLERVGLLMLTSPEETAIRLGLTR